MPGDPDVLAKATVDSLILAGGAARAASAYYWEKARPRTHAVFEAATECADPDVGSLAGSVAHTPDRVDLYQELRDLLAARAISAAVRPLLELGWEAECVSRMGYHLGKDYSSADSAEIDDWRGPAAFDGLSAGARPPVLIVIPFRDSLTDGVRLRNLTASLRSLRDQSFPRDSYQVTVVETDDRPRWRDQVSRLADHYVYAYNPGPFNRAWGVNVGVAHTPGPTEIICIMDGDILCDRDFVARNVERFHRAGAQGHLPYGNVLYLNGPSSAQAISGRLNQGLADVAADSLCGYLLRRPTGGCAWVRIEAFQRIGGMDERYEGWGGEDNDFAYRFDRYSAPMDRYPELLYHLNHPATVSLREDGEVVNGHIPAMSWTAQDHTANLDKYGTARRPVEPAGGVRSRALAGSTPLRADRGE